MDFIAIIPVRITAQQYLVALYLTILMELFIYLLLSHFRLFDRKIARLFFICVVINTITNPAVNFIYHNIYDNVVVLEFLVFVVESFMIFLLFNIFSLKIKYPKAAFISIIANLFSWLIGSPLAGIIHDIKNMFGI